MASIVCVYCGAKHDVKVEALPKFMGREIPCQKCGKKFVVGQERPEPVTATREDATEWDALEGLEDDDEAPKPRGGKGAKGSTIPRPNRPRLIAMVSGLRSRARFTRLLGIIGGVISLLSGVAASAHDNWAISPLVAGALLGLLIVLAADTTARWLELYAERIELDVNCEQLLWHIATKP